ncbi:MAG: hypothetical protein H0T42_09340 [Deltaproteobacteria bacterium]|nr:hypothetical protein [Deltaproteobacteria bacterium]
MTVERDHAALPEAISTDVALAFAQRVRKQGGAWRLWSTGILVSFPMALFLGAAAGSIIATLVGAAGSALLVRNIVQNARATAAGNLLAVAKRAMSPVAEVRDRRLWIGEATKPRTDWLSIRVSAREERQMRERAMPVARLQPRS